jgi:hypothetical protein
MKNSECENVSLLKRESGICGEITKVHQRRAGIKEKSFCCISAGATETRAFPVFFNRVQHPSAQGERLRMTTPFFGSLHESNFPATSEVAFPQTL